MTSHLLGLYVENFKRIALAEVKFNPAGGVVAIMGQNEAGKSSLLDALEVLIAGRKAQHPARPVHAGADTAKIIGTFDDITVTRQYRPDGKTQIEVKSADGLRMASAEELLRSLYSHVALDPLAFSQLSEKEQLDVLLPLIGFDPAPLDAERRAAFEKRTDVNRTTKMYQGQIDGLPPIDPKLPTEEISVAELTAELERGLQTNRDRDVLSDRLAAREERVAAIDAEIAEHERKIGELRTEGTELGKAMGDDRQKLSMVAEVDVEPIREKITNADELNVRIRKQLDRVRVVGLRDASQAEADALTAQIAEIDERKEAQLAAVTMPVPGMSIMGEDDERVLTLNGVPFSQASTGVKIRTGTAIAMLLNPDLRLIVIRDASLLDAGNRAVIDELAKANGFTVLMEIADESMPVGVVIEEGTVREVRS
ncbi:MAG: AAA family ATPase [Kofleriaceae bacterium]